MSEEGYGTNNLDERVRLLERKVADMEALIKGLTDEMLDMKAVAPPISRSKVERESPEPEAETVKPVSPPIRDKITLKMQPDGTLQPEKESGEEIIIASARDARMRYKDQHQRSGSNDLIIAEDKEPSEDL